MDVLERLDVASALGAAAALLSVALVLSAVTFGVYAVDKRAAVHAGRRVPERTLHLLAVCGGWPGALLAQSMLRHKTRKLPFRVVFGLTVVVNVLLCVSVVLVAAVRRVGA